MTRKLPRHADYFYSIARESRLPNPLGRALYACNGLQNGRRKFSAMLYGNEDPEYPKMRPEDKTYALKVLKSIRQTTADRWLKHWNSGGSIKSLCHGKHGRADRRPR